GLDGGDVAVRYVGRASPAQALGAIHRTDREVTRLRSGRARVARARRFGRSEAGLRRQLVAVRRCGVVRERLQVGHRAGQDAHDAPGALLLAELRAVAVEVIARLHLHRGLVAVEDQRELLADAGVNGIDDRAGGSGHTVRVRA